MKLGIISDCIHYRTYDGKVGTQNHVLLRQLEEMCKYYDEVLICCAFGEYKPWLYSPHSFSFYDNEKIHFIEVPVRGGQTILSKLLQVATIPLWWKKFKEVDKFSDIVYQRFPNNLNIPGFFYFWLKKKKVFGTYTGTWDGPEALSYTIQRRLWLRPFFRGPLWVYTKHQQNKKNILPGYSPSYTKAEWNEDIQQVEARISRIESEGIKSLKLITVGSLIYYRNQDMLVRACAILKQRNIPFHLTIVGGGEEMEKKIEQIRNECGLSKEEINMVGKKRNGELRALYRQHDFVLQAPTNEGFGKVPIEGMFHGTVPIINNINMASSMTGKEMERGFLFSVKNRKRISEKTKRNGAIAIADALEDVFKNKLHMLPQIIRNGREYAAEHTLEEWAEEYYNTVMKYYAPKAVIQKNPESHRVFSHSHV